MCRFGSAPRRLVLSMGTGVGVPLRWQAGVSMKKQIRNAGAKLAEARVNQFPDFPRHHQHAISVGEIHSRPFPEIGTNRVFIIMPSCPRRECRCQCRYWRSSAGCAGEAVPMPEMRYHQIPWNDGQLRWESHSEFSTFTFDAKAPKEFLGEVANHPFGNGFAPPGSMISATRIEIRPLNAANRKFLNAV